jgi:hypothetical protein
VTHSSYLQQGINYGLESFYSKGPRGLDYKTFYGCNVQIFVISYSFALGKPFLPSLMFSGEAGATNIRLGWKGLPRANTLAYYENV